MIKGKGKYNIFRLIFSRKTFSALILLVQLVFIAVGFTKLRENMVYLYSLCSSVSVILAVFEINRDENPEFKLTWVLLIGLVPVFGAILYLYVHSDIVSRGLQKKVASIEKVSNKYMYWDKDDRENVKSQTKHHFGLFNYLYERCGFPAYEIDKLKYYGSGEDFFEEFVKDLRNAKNFIFIEFFIIRPGYMWQTVLDILTEKVKQGVEVRVMYDGMGCMTLLPSDYPELMEKQGIKCKVFSPIRPFLSTYQNNRDHRKIAVIDGDIAYTGGVNLGDEYINKVARFGRWKDSAIRFTGDAVNSFSVMFLRLWEAAAKESQDYGKYLIAHPNEPGVKGYITPYSDSPIDNEAMGERVYLDMLNTAEKYVHIMTPYLVPGNEMLSAMKYAVKRGVDVKIIMPSIPDKKYAFNLARTYYPELIEAGVEIYEYTPGFVHSKVCVSDNIKAVVGSINFDFRSLYLHFECAVYVYGDDEIGNIEKDYKHTLRQCRQFKLEDYKKLKLTSRIMGRTLRIFAPLM